MGRAYGKHTPRVVQDLAAILDAGRDGPSEGDRREAGIGEPRDIPGGREHLANPPVRRQAAPELERGWRFRRADLAHGVNPDEAGHHDRNDPRLTGEVKGRPKLEAPADPAPGPVPVYIVEKAGGKRAKAYVDTRHYTVPAMSAEPIMICPDNPARSLVQLLNEDSSHNCRVGRLQDLTFDAQNNAITGGARLPSGASGYTVLRTQEALYAVSETASTVVISVIMENDLKGAL